MSYRLGLDIGIASCGFSILKTNDYGIPYKIIRLNSVVFSKGETPRGESIAANRRAYRSSRRLNRRRKFRKYRVRRLFKSPIWARTLSKYNAVQSMSNKGICLDNAQMESFFHIMKAEMMDRHYQTEGQLVEAMRI